MNTKKCTKCGIEKGFDFFYSRPEVKSGLSSRCKSCVVSSVRESDKLNPSSAYERGKRWRQSNAEHAALYGKIYRLENSQRIKESVRAWLRANEERVSYSRAAWRASNPDKVRSYSKAYKERHPDKRRESSNGYFARNRDAIKAKISAYRRANKHKVNAITAKRRAAKHSATPVWADHAEIRRFYLEARKREADTGITHHVDHIIPLIHDRVCGLHVHSNLQILTAKDNRLKSNRFEIA